MYTEHINLVNSKDEEASIPCRWRVPHENGPNQTRFDPTNPLPNTQSQILNRRSGTARRAVIIRAKRTQFSRIPERV